MYVPKYDELFTHLCSAIYTNKGTFSVCVLCHTFYSEFKGLVSYDAIISDKIYL